MKAPPGCTTERRRTLLTWMIVEISRALSKSTHHARIPFADMRVKRGERWVWMQVSHVSVSPFFDIIVAASRATVHGNGETQAGTCVAAPAQAEHRGPPWA